MMLVVGDTSPLTGLLQIGRESLLVTLFGKVLVPPAVRDELLQFHVSIPPVIETHPIHDHEAAAALGNDLGAGESEVIVLAQESQADYLLMDDNRAARRGVTRPAGYWSFGRVGNCENGGTNRCRCPANR